MTEHIEIEFMCGPEDGRMVKCTELPITIGRASDNTVHLRYDQLVSRHHAGIERSRNSFVLRDLDSANGTYLGRKRIGAKGAILKPGDLFRIGATRMALRIK